MNQYHIDTDFFSPVHLETSDTVSSDDSENLSTISNSDMTATFTKSIKNEHNSESIEIKYKKGTRDLKLNSEEDDPAPRKLEFLETCTPVLKRDAGNPKRNSKTLASDFKLELGKEEIMKDVNVMKRGSSLKNSESYQKSQQYRQRKSAADSNITKSSSEQNDVKKRSSLRPTSLLLSKNDVAKCSAKDMKKEKSIGGSSKNIYSVDDMCKSDAKHLKKNLVENSLDSKRTNRAKKIEDSCGKSTDIKSDSSSVYDSSNKKSNIKSKHVENAKPASNPPAHSSYEALIEKITHDHITSECDKIRQNIYAQQMSFYREMNKLKGEMERHHLTTRERLLKFTEELMQVNASLKSAALQK